MHSVCKSTDPLAVSESLHCLCGFNCNLEPDFLPIVYNADSAEQLNQTGVSYQSQPKPELVSVVEMEEDSQNCYVVLTCCMVSSSSASPFCGSIDSSREARPKGYVSVAHEFTATAVLCFLVDTSYCLMLCVWGPWLI